MNRVLLTVLALAIAMAVLMIVSMSPAHAQDQPKVAVDTGTCERVKAMVTDLPVDAVVRFQLGHDLVKKVQVTEQDTAAAFDSGKFPASDWGFSVRVNDQVVYDKITTVNPCVQGELPFTGPRHVLVLLTLGLALLVAGLLLLRRRRT